MARNEYVDATNKIVERHKKGESLFPISLSHPKPSRLADLLREEGKFQLYFSDYNQDGYLYDEIDRLVSDLDGQEVVGVVEGKPLFVSRISAEDNRSEILISFDKFHKESGFLEPEEVLEKTFLNGLPEKVPDAINQERYERTGNEDVLDPDLSVGRDVFRAMGWTDIVLRKASSFESEEEEGSEDGSDQSEEEGSERSSGNKKAVFIGVITAGIVAYLLMRD